MTTGSSSSVTRYGNGATTIFSTGFYFQSSSEVRVTLSTLVGAGGGTTSILTEGVEYTVNMPSEVGDAGAIVMVDAPEDDSEVLIERIVPFTQEVDLRSAGQFDPEVHEAAFDRLTFLAQQLDRRVTAVEAQGVAGDVVAGSGLEFTGSTLSVVAGNGITTAGGDVAVVFASEAPAAPGTIDANVSSDVGAQPVAARIDHAHGVFTAAAVELTDSTNAEGSASELARADHTHSHGTRGGGTLHTVATTSTAGFMSAADKIAVDAISFVTSFESYVPFDTTTTIHTIPLFYADNSMYLVKVLMSAMETPPTGGEGGAYELTGCFRFSGGIVSQIGTTTRTVIAETGSWAVSVPGPFFAISGTNLLIRVEVAEIDSNWRGQVTLIKAIDALIA